MITNVPAIAGVDWETNDQSCQKECQRHTSSMFPSNHLRWAERDAASGSLPRHRDGWNCPDFRGTREECDGVIPNSLVEVREEPKNKQNSKKQWWLLTRNCYHCNRSH